MDENVATMRQHEFSIELQLQVVLQLLLGQTWGKIQVEIFLSCPNRDFFICDSNLKFFSAVFIYF